MFAILIIYLNIFLGKLLHIVAQKEIKQWKKYILSAKNLLIIFISLIFIYINLNLKLIIGLIIGVVLFNNFKNIYLSIGLTSLLSLFMPARLIILSFLLLLILVFSSLSKFKKREIFLSTLFFAIPFILLSLLSLETFIKGNLSIFTGLAIGSLLVNLKGP